MQIIYLGSFWVKATQHIALSWGSWGRKKVTLMPHPLKWLLFGGFSFRGLKKLQGGIHDSTPKNTVKRNSERRIPRKSSENRQRSETLYQSKFSLATGVRHQIGHRTTKRNFLLWKLKSIFEWAICKETCDDHRFGGFRFMFHWPFRVSSSWERAVWP